MNEIKLTGESKDIVSDNISKLKELFPEIFVGDKIDFEKFKLNFSDEIDVSDEKFSFSWPGKNNMIKVTQVPSSATLRPVFEDSKNWENTNNLYIEGDNSEVLKLLQRSYFNKIDTIYIDPPYNTGNDILYKNDYSDNLDNYLEFSGQVDKENKFKLTDNTEFNGRYHTNWLNIIYGPIKLARNLLKDDGCIYIAIDHYELHNLIQICNEIFNEDNRVGLFTVMHNPEGRQNAKFFTYTNEYVLVYAKNIEKFNFNKVVLQENKKESADLSKIYPYKDETGLYKLDNFIRLAGGAASLRENKPSCWYPIYVSPDLKEITTEYKDNYHEIYPITDRGQERTWKLIKSSAEVKIKDGTLRAIEDKGNIKVMERYGTDKGSPITTVWINSKYNSKKYGTKIIEELFGKKLFDFPKSLYLVDDVLSLNDSKDNIVLDFFSGSATTAHAVMEKNLKDNGSRQFIMVQLPHKTDEKSLAYKEGYENICEIGKERIRRAGDKILKESNNKDLDIGFKVFKLDSSNLEKWDPNYNNIQQSLMIDSIKGDRTNEDLVYEIMLNYGMDLTLPIEKYNNIYSIGFGALIICLDDVITKDIVQNIVDLTKKSSISRVVFKDSGFKSDADKTNTKEILKINNVDKFITI